MLGCQTNQVLNGIALGLLGEEIGTGDVIERQIIESSGTVAESEMDSRFDHGEEVRYPVRRADINVIVVNLPHGNAEVVAETAEIFIYRIAIRLNLYVA